MKKKGKKIFSIFKFNLGVSLLSLGAYMAVIFLGGGELWKEDISNKKAVAGSTVSAMMRIFGPPEKPLVAGTFICKENGNSSINLNWDEITDATSYDVFRNGEIIANNIADNFFIDESIMEEIFYSYYVVAKGPAGSADSDVINISTQKCEPKKNYFIKINTFEGRMINDISSILKTKNKRPIFGGSSNLEKGIVAITISGDGMLYSKVNANNNGFWEWSPSIDLPQGNYFMLVELLNPSEMVIASTQISFEIIKDKKSNEEDDDEEDVKALDSEENKIKRDEISRKPFEIDLSIENNDVYIKGVTVSKEAYRGEFLRVVVNFSEVTIENYEIDVYYTLLDEDNNTILQSSQKVFLKDNLILTKDIELPFNLKLGKYKLRVDAVAGGVVVGNESIFILKDKPIFEIGSGVYLTYRDLISNLGWIFIGSTSFLSIFSLATLREYSLYKKAAFHITEKILKKRGFIK